MYLSWRHDCLDKFCCSGELYLQPFLPGGSCLQNRRFGSHCWACLIPAEVSHDIKWRKVGLETRFALLWRSDQIKTSFSGTHHLRRWGGGGKLHRKRQMTAQDPKRQVHCHLVIMQKRQQRCRSSAFGPEHIWWTEGTWRPLLACSNLCCISEVYKKRTWKAMCQCEDLTALIFWIAEKCMWTTNEKLRRVSTNSGKINVLWLSELGHPSVHIRPRAFTLSV